MRVTRLMIAAMALLGMVVPALPAQARPISTHSITTGQAMTGSNDDFTSASVVVATTGSGTGWVTASITRSRICPGSDARQVEVSTYNGESPLVVDVDRKMDAAAVEVTVTAVRTEISCTGELVGISPADLELTIAAVATSRPDRTRDKDTGVRAITRTAKVEFTVNGVPFASPAGAITELVAKA